MKLPKGRDFSSVVTQAPGANFEAKSAGITIDGATAGENRFIIDGVETTNPQSGMQGKRMSSTSCRKSRSAIGDVVPGSFLVLALL